MSGALKKIVKKVKKVFKKIVKVVKKVMSSKLFKVALVAASIYFGGVALGAWGGIGGAAGTAAAGAAPIVEAGATTAAINAGTTTAGAVAGGVSTAATGAATATQSGGLLSTIGSALSKNQLLTSTALKMGGAMMQGKAAQKQEEKMNEELERNNSTDLDIYNRTNRALTESGWRKPTANSGDPSTATLASTQTSAMESNSAMSGVNSAVQDSYVNTQATKAPRFYDNATNKWQQVRTA